MKTFDHAKQLSEALKLVTTEFETQCEHQDLMTDWAAESIAGARVALAAWDLHGVETNGVNE